MSEGHPVERVPCVSEMSGEGRSGSGGKLIVEEDLIRMNEEFFVTYERNERNRKANKAWWKGGRKPLDRRREINGVIFVDESSSNTFGKVSAAFWEKHWEDGRKEEQGGARCCGTIRNEHGATAPT